MIRVNRFIKLHPTTDSSRGHRWPSYNITGPVKLLPSPPVSALLGPDPWRNHPQEGEEEMEKRSEDEQTSRESPIPCRAFTEGQAWAGGGRSSELHGRLTFSCGPG